MRRLRSTFRAALRFVLLNPCFAAFLCFAAYLGFVPQEPVVSDPPISDRVAEVVGWVSRPAEDDGELIRLTVTPVTVVQESREIVYNYRLQVFLPSGPLANRVLEFGALLRFRSFLLEPRFYATPGVPDRRVRLRGKGIGHQVFLKSFDQLEILGRQPGTRPLANVFYYVQRFERFCRRVMTQEASDLILGVSLGRRLQWGSPTHRRLESLGLLHLFVVSGFHVSLVMLMFHSLARFLGKPASCLGLAAMWMYVLISGLTVSTVRAGIMASACFVLLSLGVSRQIGNALGMAGIGLLLANPGSVFDPGFQFSFAAVTAIGLFFLPHRRTLQQPGLALRDFTNAGVVVARDDVSRFRRYMRFTLEVHFGFVRKSWREPAARVLERVTDYCMPLVACSLAVHLAILPLSLFHSNLLVWTQVPANVVFGPLLALLIPAGLLLLAFYQAPFGPLLALCIDFLASRIHSVLMWAAEWSWTTFWPHPRLWEILAYILCLLVAWWTVPRKACVAVLGPVALLCCLTRTRPPRPESLSITMLDVGQGESLLIEYPNGEEALIDTGGNPLARESAADLLVRGVTARFLWHLRVRKLAFLLLTHPHSDHTSGESFISQEFRPGRVYYFDGGELLSSNNSRRVHRGHRIRVGEVQQVVLHPPGQSTGHLSINDRSLVVLLRYRGFSALLTGDIEARAEQMLASSIPEVSVLKVPHHGSSSSSSERLLETSRPHLGLVSAGKRNPFGHPSPETRRRYREAGIPLYSTAEWGSLKVQTDGETWELYHFSMRVGRFELLGQGSVR